MTLNPEPLTALQNTRIVALWKSHARELVDVKLSYELQETTIPSHAYTFVVRLHGFLTKFLEAASLDRDELAVLDPNSNPYLFVRPLHKSSLNVFANYALTTRVTVNKRCKEIRLAQATGRHIICLRHEDFLQELNHYEVSGAAPSTDFVRRESFGAFLYHMPELALQSLGCAMALAMVTIATRNSALATASPAVVDRFIDSTKIVIRFAHLNPKVQMIDIKTGLVGKLLSIKGHVVKARPKRLCVVTADFVCLKCGTSNTHKFDEGGRYSTPAHCINTGKSCKSKSFTMMRSSARYVDAQEIRLQEAQEENTVQAGRTPRQMQVELTHDLVDVCRPGDIVLVAATVEAINAAVAAGQIGKRAKETSTYKLYLRGHSLTTLSETNNTTNQRRKEQHGNSQVTYTQQQLCSITQLCHADHRCLGMEERRAFPFDLLVRSICPAIIGHHEVKAGLLLCLLGGTPTGGHSAEKGNSIRSNSHMLIVGDPGMGKSQMLLAATQLAARSVYVGGNTSSTTGLTVTLTKEAGGETGLEAGALVLADCGVCAVDEFDKMAKNHQDGTTVALRSWDGV
jgi:DNA replicative helicase MCM subunit Mcm2 (Cdc46/Mcm family)